MTYICGKRLKYNKNGFIMLEMDQEFEKLFKYLKNG